MSKSPNNAEYLIQLARQQRGLDQEAYLHQEIHSNKKRTNQNARITSYVVGQGWVTTDQRGGKFPASRKIFNAGAYVGLPVQLETKNGAPLIDAKPAQYAIKLAGRMGGFTAS